MLPIYRASAKETPVDLSESFIEKNDYIHDFNRTLIEKLGNRNARITKSNCKKPGATNDWKWHKTPTMGVYRLARTSTNMAAQHSAEFGGNYTIPSDSKDTGNRTEQILSWNGVLTNPKINVSWEKEKISPSELILYGYNGPMEYVEKPEVRKGLPNGGYVQVIWNIPVICQCSYCQMKWEFEMSLKKSYSCSWAKQTTVNIVAFTNILNGVGTVWATLLEQHNTLTSIEVDRLRAILNNKTQFDNNMIKNMAISDIIPHRCGKK